MFLFLQLQFWQESSVICFVRVHVAPYLAHQAQKVVAIWKAASVTE